MASPVVAVCEPVTEQIHKTSADIFRIWGRFSVLTLHHVIVYMKQRCNIDNVLDKTCDIYLGGPPAAWGYWGTVPFLALVRYCASVDMLNDLLLKPVRNSAGDCLNVLTVAGPQI